MVTQRILRVTALISAAILLSLPCRSHATSLLYEGFNYTPGTPLNTLNGGTGFTGAWIDGSGGSHVGFVTVQSENMQYGTLSTSGHSIHAADDPLAGASYMSRTFTQITGTLGDELWIGFLVRRDSNGGQVPASQNVFELGLIQDDQTEGLFIGDTLNNNDHWALRSMGGDFSAASNTLLSLGQTSFLVAKISWDAGDNLGGGFFGENIELFVNPTIGTTPLTPSASFTGLNLTDISRMYLNTGFAGTWSVDEIRAGTTYASVAPAIPEPSPVSLLAIGGLLAGFGIRHRRLSARPVL